MEHFWGETAANAAGAARSTLARLAQAPADRESRMAAVARTAIFEEAMLNALHARLSELRTVAK